MPNTCKININKKGKVTSITTPDGSAIPSVVKGSVVFNQSPIEKAAGLIRLKFEVFIDEVDVIVSL